MTAQPQMFNYIVEKRDPRGKRVRLLLIVSLILHAIALVVLLIIDQLRVPAVAEPAVTLTFVDFASLPPPPPPPPPPKKRTTPKKPVETKPVEVPKPTELVAPKEIPKKEEPPPEQQDEGGSDEGSEDGVEGGVVGGVAGGVVGGVVSDQKPPPKVEPPKPPEPAVLDQAAVRKKRLTGRDPTYPRQAEMRGVEATLVAKISIGPDGRVKSVQFLQSHPLFEREIKMAIDGWTFAPHIVNGRAVPVITTYKFNFRLQ